MDKHRINEKAKELLRILDEEEFDPRNGLPEELFLLASAITPIPNIDLLIFDPSNRILLSWRDDNYYGQGWHLVGGCIRMHETIGERIRKTALKELGTDKIVVKQKPLVVRDAFSIENNNYAVGSDFIRSHNISILFKCLVKETGCIDEFNKDKTEKDAGYLKWFSQRPKNILPALEETYADILDAWNDGEILF